MRPAGAVDLHRCRQRRRGSRPSEWPVGRRGDPDRQHLRHRENREDPSRGKFPPCSHRATRRREQRQREWQVPSSTTARGWGGLRGASGRKTKSVASNEAPGVQYIWVRVPYQLKSSRRREGAWAGGARGPRGAPRPSIIQRSYATGGSPRSARNSFTDSGANPA
jgi:hypothetical protein